MKCVFNFLVCKRRAIPMPLATREAAVLPREIPILNIPPSGASFPSSLAVTGCLAVLLGLQYLRGELSPKGRSADRREENSNARGELDLEPINLLGPDRASLKSSDFLRKERGQLVLQLAKPATRSVPDISSIVHAQVFGEDLRCITKLGGVDIAPRKKTRRSRRKMAKQTPPHMSAETTDEIEKPSVPEESPGGSEPEIENSCVIVHPETSTGVPMTSHEEAGRNDKVDSHNSMHEQSKPPSAKDKKPRRRLNRDPRPRHPKRAKKPSATKAPQHALRGQEGNPGNCEDAEKMRELPKVGIILDQKESRKPSESQEIAKESHVKKHRRRRKPSHHNSGEGREPKTDDTHHALGTAPGRKLEGPGKEPPRRQNEPNGGSSSRRQFPRNHSQRHSHQQSGKTRQGSPAMQSHRNAFGGSSGGKGPNHGADVGRGNQLRNDSPKVVSLSEKTFGGYNQSDQFRLGSRPYRPRNRGSYPRKEYVDLDKPQ